MEVISDDFTEEASSLIKEVSQHSSNIVLIVKNLLSRAENEEFTATKGISFLNVKSHMLLSYLSNLSYVILRKISGKAIQGDPSIDRLVELRTVLEKMRPIDEKLKYQIQKLLQSATTGNVDSEDPLHFKANPDNFANQFEDENSGDDDDEKEDLKERKSNVYVPPKISASHYEDDETPQMKQEKQLEKIKKRALSSSVLQELRQEYDTGPDEIKEHPDVHRQKYLDKMKERNRYEEEFMLRLPMTKKQKHESKRISTTSSLNNFMKFDDISALDMDAGDIPKAKRRSSKKSLQKKGKRKSFKRKRF